MREALLRDFLAGRAGVWALRRELERLLELAGFEAEPPALEAMESPFELFPRHLLLLCEAVVARELEPPALAPIARWIRRSERFHATRGDPDARVVEEVLVAWSESAPPPERDAMALYREWLVTRRRPRVLAPFGL